MLFSIILPTYNVSPYIERCIKSLQNQTYRKFEMIFVDDCGSDESICIVKHYKKLDSRIRIIRNNKNMGTYHTRKNGVEKAFGKYILFVDPDDEINSQLLENLALLLSKKSAELIFYDIEHRPKKRFFQSPLPALPINDSKNVLEAVFSKNGKIQVEPGILGKLYEKNFLNKIYRILDIDKNFRFIYSEDQLLYYTALIQKPKFLSIKYKGYIYHNNKTSITNINHLNNPINLITQQKFTISKLKELFNASTINKRDKKLLYFYVDRFLESQIEFMRRYENNASRYINHIWKSFQIVPNFKHIIRIMIYVLSFKKIRL